MKALNEPINDPAILRNMLLNNPQLQEVSSGIWSVSGSITEASAQYDSIGGAYDVVGGMDLYHQVFWGVPTEEYRRFAAKAGMACGTGCLLDAGCGSMLFSAATHAGRSSGVVIGADASLLMLERAQKNLHSRSHFPDTYLLRTNLLRTPFVPAAFDVVLSLHVAHVVEELAAMLEEMRRILKPGGKLFLTSVVLANTWRDHYLHALFRRGIMASPRKPLEIVTALQRTVGPTKHHQVGSMLFTETSVD